LSVEHWSGAAVGGTDELRGEGVSHGIGGIANHADGEAIPRIACSRAMPQLQLLDLTGGFVRLFHRSKGFAWRFCAPSLVREIGFSDKGKRPKRNCLNVTKFEAVSTNSPVRPGAAGSADGA
jgi:hypothetical protein